jgi:hypothetical protein
LGIAVRKSQSLNFREFFDAVFGGNRLGSFGFRGVWTATPEQTWLSSASLLGRLSSPELRVHTRLAGS